MSIAPRAFLSSPQVPLRNYLLALLAVNGLLFFALWLISQFGYPELLSSDSLFSHDANHYRVIRDIGYRGHNIAFFPLAPFLWRWLGLDGYGIVLTHGLVYSAAALWLAREFRFTLPAFILAATLPNAFFLLLPFSEAFFFASAVLVLVGLHRNRLPLILIGLFICTLARPAFTVFFPALLITEYVRAGLNRQLLLRSLAYALTFAVAATLVAWVQWLDTGQWFGYFAIQKDWGNFLQMPRLPLRSWGGLDALLLDAAALAVGLACMVVVVRTLLKKMRQSDSSLSPASVFAISYLAGITFVVLLFRGGALFSLNRFVFATPFAWLAVYELSKLRLPHLTTAKIGLFLLGAVAFTMLFHAYVHVQVLIPFTVLSIYLTALLATTHRAKLQQAAIGVVGALQFCYLVLACFRVLSGFWIA